MTRNLGGGDSKTTIADRRQTQRADSDRSKRGLELRLRSGQKGEQLRLWNCSINWNDLINVVSMLSDEAPAVRT